MKTTAAITLREDSLLSEDDKKDRVSFSIALDPDDPDDRTKMYATKFSAGSAEDWLKFIKEVRAVIAAKHWENNAQAQFSMLQLLLKDEAKAKFTTHVAADDIDLETVAEGLQQMTDDYLPRECAKNTHRYLNHVVKPRDMNVERFLTRLKQINSYLPLMSAPIKTACRIILSLQFCNALFA
jgi:hypothetical protein